MPPAMRCAALAATLTCVCCAPVVAQPASTLAVGKTASPIVVDGRLDEPAWADAPRIGLAQQNARCPNRTRSGCRPADLKLPGMRAQLGGLAEY
jgi:hypothetical protein